MRYDKINKKTILLNNKINNLSTEVEDLKSKNLELQYKSESITETLNSTLHEVRRFSAQLLKFSERLNLQIESVLSEKQGNDLSSISQISQSVFYTAGMISSRLSYTDIELNPRAIENQTPVRSGIYKKFDKTRRILAEEARTNRVKIYLKGESRIELDTLPVFELLPFVLLDNGVKYSPPDQTITVSFETVGGRQVVTISNPGPDVSENEISNLFEKGFRGKNTFRMPGQGLGLFLAKRVCDFHDIRIRAEIGRRNYYQIAGINYSEFRVILEF